MKRHSESCSCTNCAYKSRSKRPSVQQVVADGTRIDRLFYGKYLPLRERKLLEKLVRTRAVYDNVKDRLLSTSGSSDLTRSDYTGKSQGYYGNRKKKIIEVTDRGEVRSSNTSKLSSCCNCCSCSSLKKIKESIEKHPHVHKHYVPYENIAKYSTNAEMRAKARRRRLGSKISEKMRDLRYKSKNIRSDPCFCTLSLIKFTSKRSIKKLRSKEDAKRSIGPSISFAESELEHRSKAGQKLRSIKQSIVNSIESRFKIKKDSLSLFRAKLRKRAMRRRRHELESYTSEFRSRRRRRQKKSHHRLSGIYVKSVSSSTSKSKFKTSAVKMKSKRKMRKRHKSKGKKMLNQESQVSVLGEIINKPSQYKQRKYRTSSSITNTSLKTSSKSGVQTPIKPYRKSTTKYTINGSTQSDSSVSLKKNQTEFSLRRCFCTLKLQKKKRKLRSSTSKKTTSSFSTQHSDKRDHNVRNTQTKSIVGDHENVPKESLVLPTGCECDTEMKASYRKEIKTNRKLMNTKKIPQKSTSSLIFERKSPHTRQEKTQIEKRNTRHAKGAEFHRPSVNDMTSQVVKNNKAKPTNTEAFWHKCFCTLKLFNKDGSKKHSGTIIRPQKKKDVFVKVHSKMTTKYSENMKYFHEPSRISSFKCEPGICSPDQCNPQECIKFIKARHARSKNKYSDTSSKNIVLIHENPKLLPYECEPGVCIPGQCNPSVCEKLIKHRNIRHKNKYQETNVDTRSTYSEIPRQMISSKTQQSPSQAREKKINKINHYPKEPEQNIGSGHFNRETVRIGSNVSFNIEFYKERPLVDGIKESDYTSKNLKKQTQEKRFKKPKYTRSRPVNIKTRGSQSTTDTKHIASSAEPKTKKRHVYVGSPKKTKCFCTLKLHKKGRNAKNKENIFLTSRSTKTTLESFESGLKSSVIKSTNTSKILRRELKSYECTPGFCVPNACDPYKCYDTIKKRDIRRHRSRHIATGRELRSVLSMTSSEFSSSNKSRSTQSSNVVQRTALQEHRVKNRPDNIESNYSPSRQAVRIGSNFSFNINFYKDHYNTNTRGKTIPTMYSTVGNLTYISDIKPKSMKHRRYISKHHLLRANDIVKTNDKVPNVGNILKRCFCSLMLQSKDFGRNNNNPCSFNPEMTQLTEIIPGQKYKKSVCKLKSLNPLCITTGKLSEKYISGHDMHMNNIKFTQNGAMVRNKSQNGFKANKFCRSTHSSNNDFGKYENTNISVPKFQQYSEFQVKKKLNDPSQRNKNPFYNSFYALNLKVSQVRKIPQNLEDDECEPGFCVPYQCDTAECLRRIKSRFKSWKGTETDSPDTRPAAIMTDRMRLSHNYAQVDKHSALKVFHPTKKKKRYGSNVKLNISLYTHLDDTNKEPGKRTPIPQFYDAYRNRPEDAADGTVNATNQQQQLALVPKSSRKQGKTTHIQTEAKVTKSTYIGKEHKPMNISTDPALMDSSKSRKLKNIDKALEPEVITQLIHSSKLRKIKNIEMEPGKSRKSVHIAEPEVVPKVIYSGKYHRTVHVPTDPNEIPKSVYRGKYREKMNAPTEPKASKSSFSSKYRQYMKIRTDRASRLSRSRRTKMPEELEKFLMKPPRRKVYTIGSNINFSMQFYKEDDSLALEEEQKTGQTDAGSGMIEKIRCFCTSKKKGSQNIKSKSAGQGGDKELSKESKKERVSKGTTEEVSINSGETESKISSMEKRTYYEDSQKTEKSDLIDESQRESDEISKSEPRMSRKSYKSRPERSRSEKLKHKAPEKIENIDHKVLEKIEKSKRKIPETIDKGEHEVSEKIGKSKSEAAKIILGIKSKCKCKIPEMPKCECKEKQGRKEKGKKKEHGKGHKNKKALCDCDPKSRRLQNKSTKVSHNALSVKSDVLSYDKSTLTGGKRFTRSLYECEPHVCIPGICDPNVCFKIFKSKRGVKNIAVSTTQDVKSKLVNTPITLTSMPLAVSAAKRCFCIFQLKNKQAQNMIEKSIPRQRQEEDVQPPKPQNFIRKSIGKVSSLLTKPKISKQKAPLKLKAEKVQLLKQDMDMKPGAPEYALDGSKLPEVTSKKRKRHICKCHKNIKEKKVCECVQEYLDNSKFLQPELPISNQYEGVDTLPHKVVKSKKPKEVALGLKDKRKLDKMDQNLALGLQDKRKLNKIDQNVALGLQDKRKLNKSDQDLSLKSKYVKRDGFETIIKEAAIPQTDSCLRCCSFCRKNKVGQQIICKCKKRVLHKSVCKCQLQAMGDSTVLQPETPLTDIEKSDESKLFFHRIKSIPPRLSQSLKLKLARKKKIVKKPKSDRKIARRISKSSKHKSLILRTHKSKIKQQIPKKPKPQKAMPTDVYLHKSENIKKSRYVKQKSSKESHEVEENQIAKTITKETKAKKGTIQNEPELSKSTEKIKSKFKGICKCESNQSNICECTLQDFDDLEEDTTDTENIKRGQRIIEAARRISRSLKSPKPPSLALSLKKQSKQPKKQELKAPSETERTSIRKKKKGKSNRGNICECPQQGFDDLEEETTDTEKDRRGQSIIEAVKRISQSLKSPKSPSLALSLKKQQKQPKKQEFKAPSETERASIHKKKKGKSNQGNICECPQQGFDDLEEETTNTEKDRRGQSIIGAVSRISRSLKSPKSPSLALSLQKQPKQPKKQDFKAASETERTSINKKKKGKSNRGNICECPLQDFDDLEEETTDKEKDRRGQSIIEAVRRISRSLKSPKSPSLALSLKKQPKQLKKQEFKAASETERTSINEKKKGKSNKGNICECPLQDFDNLEKETTDTEKERRGQSIIEAARRISRSLKSLKSPSLGLSLKKQPKKLKTQKIDTALKTQRTSIYKKDKSKSKQGINIEDIPVQDQVFTESKKNKSHFICECYPKESKPTDKGVISEPPPVSALGDLAAGDTKSKSTKPALGKQIGQGLPTETKAAGDQELVEEAKGKKRKRKSQKIEQGPATLPVCPCCGKSDYIQSLKPRLQTVCECHKPDTSFFKCRHKKLPLGPVIPGLENACPVCLRQNLTDICTCGLSSEKKNKSVHLPAGPFQNVCPECSKKQFSGALQDTISKPPQATSRKNFSGEPNVRTIKQKEASKKKTSKKDEPPPPPIFSMYVDATNMKVKNKEEIYRNLGIGCKDRLQGRYLPPLKKGQVAQPSIDLVINRDNASILRPDDMIKPFGDDDRRNYSIPKKREARQKPGTSQSVACPICNALQVGGDATKRPQDGEQDGEQDKEHDKHCTCCICTDKDGKRKKGHPKNCTCCICRYGCRFGSMRRPTDAPGAESPTFLDKGLLLRQDDPTKKKVEPPKEIKKKPVVKKKVVPVALKAQNKFRNFSKALKLPRSCYCGLKICEKEIEKLDKKASTGLQGEIPPPCVCGSYICKKKYTKKSKYYRLLEKKRLKEHKRKKERFIRWKKEAKKRIKEQEAEDADLRKRILRQDKRAMKVLEKYIDDTNSWVLLAENASEIGRFGINTMRRMITSVKRCVRHPFDVCYRAQVAREDPRRAAAKALEEFQGSGYSGMAARVRQRCAAMQTSKYLISALEKHPVTNYLLHFRDRDPRKRLFKRKPEKEPPEVECSPFLTSLRQKPCLWLYRLCPWFYPHCLGLLAVWRQFTDVVLFLLAVVVWSPCILLTEFCRSLMCCLMCAGGG